MPFPYVWPVVFGTPATSGGANRRSDGDGTDVLALLGLPDPEILASGSLNIAYALARRLVTPPGALEEIGDTAVYDSLDVHELLGWRPASADDLRRLEARIVAAISGDERVTAVEAVVAYASRALSISVRGEATEGPFSLVLSVDDLSVAVLEAS